jgi:hypothetical protein
VGLQPEIMSSEARARPGRRALVLTRAKHISRAGGHQLVCGSVPHSLAGRRAGIPQELHMTVQDEPVASLGMRAATLEFRRQAGTVLGK